jgi:hypothetical protein
VKLQILKTEYWMTQMVLLQLLQQQAKKEAIVGLGFAAVPPADKKHAATVANNSITL